MAKYEIKHKCGHYQTHQIFGKMKNRDWQESRLEDQLCTECWKKEQEENRKKQIEEQVQKEDYISTMEDGSEKQIEWAKKIKIDVIKEIEEKEPLSKNRYERCCLDASADPEKKELFRKIVIKFDEEKIKLLTDLKIRKSAKWWINNRDNYAIFNIDEGKICKEIKNETNH